MKKKKKNLKIVILFKIIVAISNNCYNCNKVPLKNVHCLLLK